MLIRVSQHTNITLAELAQVVVTRVRERGPAQQCRVVTEVLEGLLIERRRAGKQAAAPIPDNHEGDV